MSKENRKEIKGIDPKSYGDFDKFMDKVQKISRYVFPVFGASLTAGCTVEMIDAIVKTSQAGETNPLPSDSTKTPESPTEANYELTPTLQNTATATEMPTITMTLEPTPTATEMPTPTEIPEKYPIDLEKLHNFPQSYEYVVAHPKEFVEAPNPLKDIDVFNDWFYNKFVPILGEWTEREANYNTSSLGMAKDFFVATTFSNSGELFGKPEFFYFVNNGTLYPVFTINIFTDNQESFLRTISIILYNGFGAPEGTGVIESLAMNKKIDKISLIRNEYDDWPEDVNNLIKMGINANMPDQYDYNQVVLGVARIKTRE